MARVPPSPDIWSDDPPSLYLVDSIAEVTSNWEPFVVYVYQSLVEVAFTGSMGSWARLDPKVFAERAMGIHPVPSAFR